MKIQWLGHSAFRLIESTGTAIITDPFEPAAVGYGMAYAPADAITCSHGHSDHNNFKGVKGNPIIINSLGSYDVKGIHISSVLSSHDEVKGPMSQENIIYKYRLDGVTVCHMGDIGEDCSIDLVEELIPVNILLIPIGGGDTIDAEQAKEYISKIMPDIVIPMHYKIKHTELDIDKLDAFLKLFDDEQIEELDSTNIEFDRYDFNGESTRVLVPQRYKG